MEAWWAVGVAAVTAGWVGVCLAGGDPAPVATDSTGAAAAAGTAAVTGSALARRFEDGGAGALGSTGFEADAWLAGATLVLLPAAVAAAADGSAGLLALVVMVLAGAEVVKAAVGVDHEELWSPGLTLAAVGLLLAAVATGRQAPDRWPLPSDDATAAAIALAAAAGLLAAAALGPPRDRVLGPPALLIAVVAAPGLPALAVAIGGGAVAVVSAAVLGHRPTIPLGALAAAASALPATRPAAMLLAAAAALALAVGPGHPGAALLGLPGAALLAAALLGSEPGGVVAALALGTAATAVLLVWRAALGGVPRVGLGRRGWWAAVPAATLAAWLLLGPGSWRWAGVSGAGPYDRGAAAAVAGGAIAVVLVRAWTAWRPTPTEGPEAAGPAPT